MPAAAAPAAYAPSIRRVRCFLGRLTMLKRCSRRSTSSRRGFPWFGEPVLARQAVWMPCGISARRDRRTHGEPCRWHVDPAGGPKHGRCWTPQAEQVLPNRVRGGVPPRRHRRELRQQGWGRTRGARQRHPSGRADRHHGRFTDRNRYASWTGTAPPSRHPPARSCGTGSPESGTGG